ncbi:hypothetical protein Gobs01_03960 [Geodermatophilus obscurus DSM 43160]|uniref:Uncharacterized protein n=1 Tax=Geodermatophilus obscurus (strain ATCC 25078 / DSM 43160 / JCM 3152 / CCUG 61914 / KCC A-0152 / KCTC 9177 / NBRC 13315 / NRRL B-3577 / G-20) TaxID=526225 RepID=D2S892_GEOOG|nr:hypothetical protein Gobs_0745 [Geodermatophilus obscurus DSM 43160]
MPPPSGVPGQGEGLPGRIRPLSVKPPPRILLMAASPSEFEPLDGRAEWDKVAGALDNVRQDGLVQQVEAALIVGQSAPGGRRSTALPSTMR